MTMYMKNVTYKILMGCYIVAALVLVTACNDGLDIQQAYPFTVETLPVPGHSAGLSVHGGDAARTQETESRGNRRNPLPVGAKRSLPAYDLPDTLFPA